MSEAALTQAWSREPFCRYSDLDRTIYAYFSTGEYCVFFDCSRIKQHKPTGAALAAAPHERAGFARADTPRSILPSSSDAGARLRRLTGSVFPARNDSGGHIFDSSRTACTPNVPLVRNPGEPPSGSGALEGMYDIATELTRAPRADLPPRRASLRSRLRGAQATGGGDGARPTTCPRVAVRTARRSPRTRVWPLVLLQTRQALVRGRNRGWNSVASISETRRVLRERRLRLYEILNSSFPLADAQRVLHRATEVANSNTRIAA